MNPPGFGEHRTVRQTEAQRECPGSALKFKPEF